MGAKEAVMKLSSIARALIFATLAGSCSTSQSFDRLPPLEASEQSELRISIAYYPSALRTAYVVTSSSITVFDYDGSRWRARIVETTAGAQVLDAAADLAGLHAQDLGCNIYDGNSVSVEAVIEHTRFSFSASNPDFCGLAPDALDARRVHHLLQMIEREAYVSQPILIEGSVRRPCFTFESEYRATRMVRSITPDRTVSRPVGPLSVVLQCEQRPDRGIDCVVIEESESPYPLAETALAYASVLETCSGEPARFLLPMIFQH